MKREIKFRAWNGIKMEYNIMAGWLGGYYVQGIDPKDTACLSPFNTKLTELTNVMQFTGLLDKNGKEIYEGDILHHNGKEIYQPSWTTNVWFDRGTFLVDTGEMKKNLGMWNVSYLEVIGNVYDNPELIK